MTKDEIETVTFIIETVTALIETVTAVLVYNFETCMSRLNHVGKTTIFLPENHRQE